MQAILRRILSQLALAVYLCLASTLFAANSAWAAPPDGISINAEVGYGNYVALGQVNPVIVEMENTSAGKNLSGELVLEYNGVEYVTRLELPTPSKKKFFLYFPCDNWPPILTLKVRTKQYTEEFDLGPSFKTMAAGDISIVVLTSQPGSLGVVNQLTIASLDRDLYGNETAAISSGKIFVSYFDLDSVDANPKFFSRAQSIILSDIDYQQVSQDLAEALKASATGGTSVLFTLGLNGAGVAGSPLGDLCPIQATGTVQVTDLGTFGSRYGIDAALSPATLAVGQLLPGAKVESWAGGHPVVASTSYGSGKITAMAFDFTAVPFKQNPALAQVFVDNALQVNHSAGVRDWFVHPGPVSDILELLTEAKPMQPGFVLLFLSCYIVLIGPLNFFVLGRMKRKTLIWVSIPVIILAFSWFGLNTGYLTRGSDNVTAYFQELHVFPGSSYTPYQTNMLVFTAERTNYELIVPDRSAFLYTDIPQVVDATPFASGSRQRFRGLSGGKVDNSTQPVITTAQGQWTTKNYYYQGNLGLQTQVSADLSAVHKERELRDVEGSFTLDLPFDLHQSYIFAPYHTQQVGMIKGSGTYELPGLMGEGASPFAEDNYLAGSVEALGSLQRQNAFPGMLYRDEILLVGFTDKVSVLAEFAGPHREYRLTMVVVHLPYTPRIPTSGRPEVSRVRMVGGAGFEIYQSNWGYGRHQFDEPQYFIEPEGYIDVSYELAGAMGTNNHLLLSLRGNQMKDDAPISDFSRFLTVLVERDGIWREHQINADSPSIFLDISGAINDERQVVVRYKSKSDLLFLIPTGDFSSM